VGLFFTPGVNCDKFELSFEAAGGCSVCSNVMMLARSSSGKEIRIYTFCSNDIE